MVSIQYKILLVRLHVYRFVKTYKAYKLFENSDADLSWLLQEANLFISVFGKGGRQCRAFATMLSSVN